MNAKIILAGAAALGLLALPALAQMNHDGHTMPGMDMGTTMDMSAPKGDQGPSAKAFAEANARMHKDMDIAFTGDTDVDFVRGMIAHHQGAIDMAKVELKYGKDPAIRSLAEGIIKAQEGEIAMMKQWLADHGG